MLAQSKCSRWMVSDRICTELSDFGSNSPNQLYKALCGAFFNASNSQVLHGFA